MHISYDADENKIDELSHEGVAVLLPGFVIIW